MSSLRWLCVLSLCFAAACGDDGGGKKTDDGGADGGQASALVINELMPSNAASCVDPDGGYDDWIELYNGSDEDIDLAGYAVTDDPATPLKMVLGEGLVVPAGGYLLLWADEEEEQGADHLNFKLGASGETFQIYAPGGGLVDEFEWTNAPEDVSYARIPNADGDFESCRPATCGASNGNVCEYTLGDAGTDAN